LTFDGRAQATPAARIREPMMNTLKTIAKRLLVSEPVASYFVNRVPVERWPSLYGRAQEVRLPSLTEPLAARTAACGSNINILFKLLKSVAELPGDVAECGVYQGATLVPMGLYLHQNEIPKTVFGCDSFEGFDEAVLSDIALGGGEDPEKKMGGFSNTSDQLVQEKIRRLGLQERVSLLKGYFQETLRQLANRSFSFVHLDCDLYDSYKTCLEFFYPRLTPGGIILFDEYNDPAWPGCNKAVDEFFAGRREKPTEIESDNYLKHYVQKL
jgi:O-methyltransferase